MSEFIGAYREALVRFGDFRGRTSLGGFWRFFAVNVAIGFVLGLLAQSSTPFVVIYVVYGLALLLPNLSCGARRLHDTGLSGWLMLLVLVPIVGAIVLIVLWARRSDGPNRWGAAPVWSGRLLGAAGEIGDDLGAGQCGEQFG